MNENNSPQKGPATTSHWIALVPHGVAGHVLTAPGNSEAPDTPHVGGQRQINIQTIILRQAHSDGKQFATLRMQMPQLRELPLQGPARGGFLMDCWGRCGQLSEIDAAAALLCQAGDHHG